MWKFWELGSSQSSFGCLRQNIRRITREREGALGMSASRFLARAVGSSLFAASKAGMKETEERVGRERGVSGDLGGVSGTTSACIAIDNVSKSPHTIIKRVGN
jgi:hypothetical protein